MFSDCFALQCLLLFFLFTIPTFRFAICFLSINFLWFFFCYFSRIFAYFSHLNLIIFFHLVFFIIFNAKFSFNIINPKIQSTRRFSKFFFYIFYFFVFTSRSIVGIVFILIFFFVFAFRLIALNLNYFSFVGLNSKLKKKKNSSCIPNMCRGIYQCI